MKTAALTLGLFAALTTAYSYPRHMHYRKLNITASPLADDAASTTLSDAKSTLPIDAATTAGLTTPTVVTTDIHSGKPILASDAALDPVTKTLSRVTTITFTKNITITLSGGGVDGIYPVVTSTILSTFESSVVGVITMKHPAVATSDAAAIYGGVISEPDTTSTQTTTRTETRTVTIKKPNVTPVMSTPSSGSGSGFIGGSSNSNTPCADFAVTVTEAGKTVTVTAPGSTIYVTVTAGQDAAAAETKPVKVVVTTTQASEQSTAATAPTNKAVDDAEDNEDGEEDDEQICEPDVTLTLTSSAAANAAPTIAAAATTTTAAAPGDDDEESCSEDSVVTVPGNTATAPGSAPYYPVPNNSTTPHPTGTAVARLR